MLLYLILIGILPPRDGIRLWHENVELQEYLAYGNYGTNGAAQCGISYIDDFKIDYEYIYNATYTRDAVYQPGNAIDFREWLSYCYTGYGSIAGLSTEDITHWPGTINWNYATIATIVHCLLPS